MKKTTLFVLSVFILFSCKKKNENTCTISAAVIAGSYKITAATYKASATAAETDYLNILFELCERDDIYTFNAAGTYQLADVGMICTPSGSDNGTWSLSGTTVITIDGDPLTLESFDCKQLILVNTDTQAAGDKLKLTLTRQ